MSEITKKFRVGTRGKGVDDAGIEDKQTQPPLPYTEGTLLKDMKNAAKFISDPRWKEALKEAEGIGTPATRANIIEELKKDESLKIEKKYLRSTDKGKAVIKLLPKNLSDPGVTAVWESQLKDIAEKGVSPSRFMSMQEGQVHKLIETIRGKTIVVDGLKKEKKASAYSAVEDAEEYPCSAFSCSGGGNIRLLNGPHGQWWACSNGGKKGNCSKRFIDDDGMPKPREESDSKPSYGNGEKKPYAKTGGYSKPSGYANSSSGKKTFAKSASARKKFEPENIPPLPGHGQICPKCKAGSLSTKKVFKKDSQFFGKRFLACTTESCRPIWENSANEMF